MSVHVLSWAWKQPLSNPTRKLVLLKLADSANDDGVCWPFVSTIARDVGVSVRSIERHVAALRSDKLVDVEPREREDGGQTGNLYRVIGYRTPPTPASGAPDTSDPTPPTPASGVARASTPGPLEPSVEPPPSSPPALASVDRRPVTTGEQVLAQLILDDFNAIFGTSFRSPDHLRKIILRIREYPELTRAEHREIMERNARYPWWKGAPSPAVVYGNGALFERAMLAGQGERENLSAAETKRIADEEDARLRGADAEGEVVAEEDE